MRKAVRWLGGVVLLVVAIAGMGLAYLVLAYPKVGPAPDVTAPSTAEAIARGRYLADHVSMCTDCHTPRDWSRFAGPIDDARLGTGGELFDESMGLPGRIVSKNITPAALASWTDGEILRAFTEGVAKDGTSLFPLMPYHAYGRMDRDDALAIVAYLRTLPTRASEIPERHLQFPVSLLVRTLPAPAQFSTRPDVGDRVAYGQYLATIGGCGECHTPIDEGRVPQLDRAMSGGQEFVMPGGAVARTANLTPHETGIGGWSEAEFIERFARFREETAYTPVPQGAPNTPMPWGRYAGMTDEDLGAIYAYLRTVRPVENRVVMLQAAR
jgi:mono/diheme cytochrome c family protein